MTTESVKMSCLCCGTDCGTFREPHRATAWSATGNYGSTLYDPMTGSCSLQVYICDTCLKEREDRVISINTEQPRPVHTLRRGILSPEDDWGDLGILGPEDTEPAIGG